MARRSILVIALLALFASSAAAFGGGGYLVMQAIASARSTNYATMNFARSLSLRGAPLQSAHFSSRTFDVDAATESLVIDEPAVQSAIAAGDFNTEFGMQFTLSIGSSETGSVCYTFVARTASTSCVTACATLAAGDLTCTLTGDVTSDGFPVRPGQAVTEWITGEDCICGEASEANVDVAVKQVSRYPEGG